jgi:hypothetical protein
MSRDGSGLVGNVRGLAANGVRRARARGNEDMTHLEGLEQRRALVLRSAKLQRATIALRLNRIETRPGMTLFESTLHFLQKSWGRRAAIIALGGELARYRTKA